MENTFSYQQLNTSQSAREILERDFPEIQWPIAGGWGYTPETAVKIHANSEMEGIEKEYDFAQGRALEECSLHRGEGQGLCYVSVEKGTQRLELIDGIAYDAVEYTISGFHENDRRMIIEKLGPQWYKELGEMAVQMMLEDDHSKRVTIQTVCWFDISDFFGKF